MRIPIIIFIAIILSGISIYYVWQKGIPQGWAKTKIINEVEKRINGNLTIKNLHFKFPDQAILEGVKLNSIAQIEKIICNYNLMTPIIQRGKLESGISKIVIINPSLELYRDKTGKWNISSIFKDSYEPTKKSPAMTILIKKATLKVKDEIFGTQTTLTDFYLSYYPEGPPPYFHIRLGQEMKISGNIYQTSPLTASFNLRIIKKELSPYAEFLKTPWVNLLQGQISGNIAGEIEDKNITLFKSNLYLNKGVVKLTHLEPPITNITGNFSLEDNHSVIAEKIKFKFKDIDFTTQNFYIKNMAGGIEFVTSKFSPQSLGDIFPYLKKLNLKSILKFKGKFDFGHSFSLMGEAELLNQTQAGYKFPILTKFRYKDKRFEEISLVIAKNTQITGKLALQQELNLKAKFDQSNLLPLLTLVGKEESGKGTITGEITTFGKLNDIQYNGDLKLQIQENPSVNEIVAKLKGDKKSIVFSGQIVQPQGKIDIEGKGTRGDMDEPFSLLLNGKLNEYNLLNRLVCANISFDGKLSTKTRLIGGQIKAENIIIDKKSYLPCQGSLIYNHPDLNITTSPENKQLELVAKITLSQPLSYAMQIKTKDVNLGILTQNFEGTFDGEFDIKKMFRQKTTIIGKSFKVNLINGRSVDGDFKLERIKNKVSILSLTFNEPGKMNLWTKGEVDLTCSLINLDGKICYLKHKDLILTADAKFKGHLSKSELSGILNLTGGKVNDFLIDYGKIDFKYAHQKVTIKESGIVLNHGGILTTFGTFTLKGNLDLKFSLLGMDYEDMPYDYFKNFKGEFDVIGDVKGDINNPVVVASVESKKIIIGHEKIAKIAGKVNYLNHEFQIEQVKLNDRSSLQGTFRVKDKYINGLIQIDNEKLSAIACLFSLPNLQGIIKGKLTAEGKLDNLILKCAVDIEDFHIPGFDARYGKVEFSLKDKILLFQKLYFTQHDGGKVDFKKYQVEIKPNGQAILTATLTNLIITNTIFNGKVYFTGEITPWDTANGTLTTKNLLINQSDVLKVLAAQISYEKGILNFLPLPEPNSLSGRVKFGQKLEFEEIKILKSNVEKISLNGRIELVEKRRDLRIAMQNSDLRILPLWFKEIKRPEGKVEGWLHIGGSFDEPQFDGSLMITNGALNRYPFAKRLTNLNGQIRIVNNWIVSNSLQAKVGESILVMQSTTPFTLKSIDVSLKNFHEPVPISIPGFFEGNIDVNIQIKGDITAPIGSGEIKIVNSRFTFPPKIKTAEGRMQWDKIMITASKNVKYYNEYVDVTIKRKGSWLTVSNKGDEIWAQGIIYAQSGGRVNYLSKFFTIKKASLEFREGNIFPYLSGYATTRLDKRQITLIYEGYLTEAKPILQAIGGYPPLNEEQIINALLIGNTEYLETTDYETILRLGFEQVVGKEVVFTLLVPLEKQLSQLIGMDVEIKTQALNRLFQESLQEQVEERKTSSIFEESEFKIGKFISDDVYLTYRGILEPWEEEEFARLKLKQELGLEYYLSGNTSLKYKFTPEGVWEKGNEYEVRIEREVRF
ncbi:MAG: translocation/assembly module TamB domain-containing protein [bacterium]